MSSYEVQGRSSIRRSRKPALALLLLFLLPVFSWANDWPQWRGPNRDAVWSETNVLKKFPAEGLKIRWRAPVGRGWSSPVVAQGRVVVTDVEFAPPKARERVLCFDQQTGNLLWVHRYTVDYPEWAFDPNAGGPRATPVIQDGKVFALGSVGNLFCLDAVKGNVVWAKSLAKEYGLEPFSGVTASPLIDDELLILYMCGKPAACVVAFNKTSGKEVWRALDDSFTYSSPIIISAAGRRQLIVWTQQAVTSLDPATGRIWWRELFRTPGDTAVSTPVFANHRLLIGGLMMKLDADQPMASVVWPETRAASKTVLSNTSTALLQDDCVFSAKTSGELVSLDAGTGKEIWRTNTVTSLSNGSSIHLTLNGDSVLLFTDQGNLIRARLSREGYEELSRAHLIDPTTPFGGRDVVWPPPAYAGCHVLARNDKDLICASLETAPLAFAQEAKTSREASGRFVDVTKSSGVGNAIDRQYERHPKWWLSGLNLVDLDNDGQLDLFLAAHGAGRSLALLNNGHGQFTEAEGSYPASEIHLAADINEDGRLDLQMTWQDGGGKWWLNESSPGRLNFRESNVTAGQARANAMIDLNRDGTVDWLHERPGVAFEFGDGQGNFKPGGHLEVAPTRNEINIHPADFNGDGFIDLALHWGRYDYERGRSRIYLNDQKMNLTDATAAAGLREDGLAIKGVGDANQDGHLDLLVLEDRHPELYLNDGQGRFTRRSGAFVGMETASKPRYVSWGLAVVTDFDNDGIADVLWNGRHFLWLLRGTGDGTFTYMNKIWEVEDKSSATVDDGLCFGDIDGDGDLDILGYTGRLDSHRLVKVHRNDVAKGNWLRVRLTGAAGNRGASGAKIRICERGQPEKLIWFEQVTILDSQSAHSYYSLASTERHFGLGLRREVEVRVEFYPSGKCVARTAKANSTVLISEAD